MLVADAMFGYVLVKVLNKATNSLEKGTGNQFPADFAKLAKAASCPRPLPAAAASRP
jgi:hypothetical protein